MLTREKMDYEAGLGQRYSDPLDLQSKINLLSKGYMAPDAENEHHSVKPMLLAKKLSATKPSKAGWNNPILKQERLRTYSMVLFNINISYKLMQRTLAQWNVMMRNKEMWLGNVLMKDNFPVYSYIEIPRLGLTFMIQSISNV